MIKEKIIQFLIGIASGILGAVIVFLVTNAK